MPHRTVLATGAFRGIGKAIAVRFTKKGYNVAISCVHKEDRLLRTQKGIELFQVPCLVYKRDVGDVKHRKELYGKVKTQSDGVDVLVNSTGISYIGPLQDMTCKDWEKMLCTNLVSVFNCCEPSIPYMLQQEREKIINISSVWGVVGAFCETTYSAMRGGINVLTKALVKELVPSSIQANTVACGAIGTEMNQWMEEDDLIALVGEIPSGRLGRVGEVADLVYRLGYKESYLTGQVIGLDGGWIWQNYIKIPFSLQIH